jgi:hypothetical protein
VGENEVILERALFAFHRSSFPFTPMVAVLGRLEGFHSSREEGRAAHELQFSGIRRRRLITACNVIYGKHFLTSDDIFQV